MQGDRLSEALVSALNKNSYRNFSYSLALHPDVSRVTDKYGAPLLLQSIRKIGFHKNKQRRSVKIALACLLTSAAMKGVKRYLEEHHYRFFINLSKTRSFKFEKAILTLGFFAELNYVLWHQWNIVEANRITRALVTRDDVCVDEESKKLSKRIALPDDIKKLIMQKYRA